MREALRPSAIANELLFPVLRLLVLFHGVLLLGQIWGMEQVYRHDFFEVIAFSPLFLFWLSVRSTESLKLLFILWPMCFAMVLLSFFFDDAPMLMGPAIEHARSIFLHICLGVAGYASFLLVTLCASVYLWQRHLLKHYNNALVLKYMPNLTDLSAMQWRALIAGVVFLTVAIGYGKLSPYLWGIPHHWGGKEVLSVLIWVNYVVLALLKKRWMLNKEHFAYGTIIGLILILSTFAFIGWGDPSAVGAQP